MRGQRGPLRVAIMAKMANDIAKGFLQSGDFRGMGKLVKTANLAIIRQSVIKKSNNIQFKVDRLQIIVVAKNISTCRSSSSSSSFIHAYSSTIQQQ